MGSHVVPLEMFCRCNFCRFTFGRFIFCRCIAVASVGRSFYMAWE